MKKGSNFDDFLLIKGEVGGEGKYFVNFWRNGSFSRFWLLVVRQ